MGTGQKTKHWPFARHLLHRTKVTSFCSYQHIVNLSWCSCIPLLHDKLWKDMVYQKCEAEIIIIIWNKKWHVPFVTHRWDSSCLLWVFGLKLIMLWCSHTVHRGCICILSAYHSGHMAVLMDFLCMAIRQPYYFLGLTRPSYRNVCYEMFESFHIDQSYIVLQLLKYCILHIIINYIVMDNEIELDCATQTSHMLKYWNFIIISSSTASLLT